MPSPRTSSLLAAGRSRSPNEEGMALYTAEAVESSLAMAAAALALKNSLISSLQQRLDQLEANSQRVQLAVHVHEPAEVVKLCLDVSDAAVSAGIGGAAAAPSKGTDAEQQQSKAEGSVQQLTAQLEEARASLAQSQGEVAQLQAAVAERDGAVAQLQAAVAERDGAAAQLQAAVAERDGAVAQLQADDVERDAAVEQVQATVAERDAAVEQVQAAVAERDAAVEQVQATVAQRDAVAAQLQAAVAERGAAVAQLQAAVAERGSAVEQLQAAIAERDAAVAQMQQSKAQSRESVQQLSAQLEEVRVSLARSHKEVAQLQAVIVARDEAIQVEAERAAAEITELKAAIAARDEAVVVEAERAAAEMAELKAALASRDETIAQLQQSKTEAESRAAQLSPQLRLGGMKLRAAEAQLHEAQGSLAECKEEIEWLRARVASRDETIVQLEGAKAEMEAAMEVRQTEQVQLLDTLQQYLGMCDAAAGTQPSESPEVHRQEVGSTLRAPWPEGSPSVDRVRRLEERLEFWQQRLESAAKLRSRHSSPEGAEGTGQAGGGSGEQGMQLEGRFAAEATASGGEAGGKLQGGVGQALLSALLASSGLAPQAGSQGNALEQTPVKFKQGNDSLAAVEGEGEEGSVLGGRAVTPPRPIPNAQQPPLASHPIVLSPSGSMYSGLGSGMTTPVGSLSGSLLQRSSLRNFMPTASEGAGANSKGTAGAAGSQQGEQEAQAPPLGGRTSNIPRRPSNLSQGGGPEVAGAAGEAAEQSRAAAAPPSSTLYRPAARAQGIASPTKAPRASPPLSPSLSEGELHGLSGDDSYGPRAPRRNLLTASGRGGAASAGENGQRSALQTVTASASKIPRPGGRPLPSKLSGEERDIQGAFATELLDRLNIGSPKKGGGGSRVSFRE